MAEETTVRDAANEIFYNVENLQKTLNSISLWSLTVGDLAAIKNSIWKVKQFEIWIKEQIPWK